MTSQTIFDFNFAADKTTCCCDGVENCCWNDCKDITSHGEIVDENCKEGINATGIDFSALYWEMVSKGTPNETDVLLGHRTIEYVGKF